jgi:hypothetical protein
MRMHEEAQGPFCVSCGERITDQDDPEARYCMPCWQEEQAYRFSLWCDAQAKEINRGEG